ncbi:MAG: hypothetical protein GY950_08405, partial [bacterium]|nr:hypothetical protein [bacterium]
MRKYALTSLEEFKEAEAYWLNKLSGELNETRWYDDFRQISRDSYTEKIYTETGHRTLLENRQTALLNKLSKNNPLSSYIVL